MEEDFVAGEVLADKSFVDELAVEEAAVGVVVVVVADPAVGEDTRLDVVAVEVEPFIVEGFSSVTLLVCVTEAELVVVVVVGDSAETTRISVSVTVAVESLGVAVTISVIVVGEDVTVSTTVVAGAVELLPPPSMATTEYVSRGRRAWYLPTWRSCSAKGRHADGV